MTSTLRQKFLEFTEQQAKADVAGIESQVLLVDSMNTYIRCFAASTQMDENGNHIGGVAGYLKSVGATVRSFRPTRVVCVFDGAGGSARRRKLHPEYKENRKTMVRLNRTYDFSSLEEEKHSMKQQMALLVAMLETLPVNIFSVENIEADDTIAYLSKIVQERGGNSIIMSTDKDFLQLVNDNCSVYNPIKKKMYQPPQVLDDYGVHPNNFLLYRIMEGDVGDNIAGIKGIAKKTLVKNFPYLTDEEVKTVQDIITDCYVDGKPKNKACEKIIEGHSSGLLVKNEKLMDLQNINIAGSTKLKILDSYDKKPHKLNKEELTNLIHQNMLGSSFGDFNAWVRNTWIPLTRFG